MAYEPKTTPGGNGYLGGNGTFAQIVSGFQWIAQNRDGLDTALRTELEQYANQTELDAISAANTYTDDIVAVLPNKQYVQDHANAAESDAITAAGTYTDQEVGEDRARMDVLETRLPVSTEADYAHAFADADGSVALGVRGDGSVEMQAMSVSSSSDADGYAYALGDSDGRIALGIRSDGVVEANGREIQPKTALNKWPVALTTSGGSKVDTRTAVHGRHPFMLGVDYTIKAVHIRNHNDRSATAFTGALSFTGVYIGDHALGAYGQPTGRFVSAPARVADAFTTPADGAEYVIDGLNIQVKAGQEKMLSYGYTCAAQSNHQGDGGGWTTTTPGDAAVAAPAGMAQTGFMPLDWWLEIETSAPGKAVIGDSLSAGVSSSLPIYYAPLAIHARANGYVPVLYAHSGSGMNSWLYTSQWKYQKWAKLSKPGCLVFALGKNDIANGITVDTMQTRFESLYPAITTISTKLYTATILPSADDSTSAQGTVRRAWNDRLLTQLTGGAVMVFDSGAAVADGAGNLAPANNSGDGVHLNQRGYMAVARSLNQTL